MEQDYLMEYQKIVMGNVPPVYQDPEEQGKRIKKYSILKPIDEIEYHSLSPRDVKGM